MVNWQVTATTIYCDAVDDEATLMVYKDGSVKCAAYPRYNHPDKRTSAGLAGRAKKLGRQLECEGPLCSRMTRYRDEQFRQEMEKS
jgi:hypothetical protein